eukprot:1060213-Alexandrium_andersonii.AAC.1
MNAFPASHAHRYTPVCQCTWLHPRCSYPGRNEVIYRIGEASNPGPEDVVIAKINVTSLSNARPHILDLAADVTCGALCGRTACQGRGR